ncbi:hypothetical protein BGZ98_001307 [Dissophora globulifera]|nr:hypothetical protein BGZ98_001307 [Dissophora globulifera]
MAQRLDLAIAPGKHLGWFRLGMSLWDVIRLLREQAALIPVVELKYSEEDPFAADIVLRLASNGIELRFEPYSQRLKVIKVDDFSRLRLTYMGGEVSSSKVIPTCILINDLIGPTFPGEFDSSKNLYTLSYPGLSLVFPIPEKLILLYQSSAEMPIEFPDGNTPVASHMYIFHGADWISAMPLPVATLARNIQDGNNNNSPGLRGIRGTGEGRPELERVVAKINYGAVLQFASVTSQASKCQIQLHVTTPQDLLADLGSPGSIYYKEDDKMQIHSDSDGGVAQTHQQQKQQQQQTQQQQQRQNQMQDDDGILGEMDDIGYDRTDRRAQGSQQPHDYFYNYFHLGIDVLFDGSTHRCKKIVMHTNVPGHFDFQSYKRCPFVLHLPSSSGTNLDAGSARLPPIAPGQTSSPPTHTAGVPISEASATSKQSRKKRLSHTAGAAIEASELHPSTASNSSGDSPRGSSPELLGSSPGQMPMEHGHSYQQTAATGSGGLMSVSPEKGITPDMKIPMVMALLDPSGSGPSAGSAAGVPNKQGLLLNRGSSSQNPFRHTTLWGTDGVVFEAMQNGHVSTVVLY